MNWEGDRVSNQRIMLCSTSRVGFQLVGIQPRTKRKEAKFWTYNILVTHDPNMLKNKSRGNLVGKIKVSFTEGKWQNFC